MNAIKYPAIAIGLAVSCLSAVLTFKFLSTTGQAIGLGLVFGAMGVCLDATKSFLPLAIITAHQQKKTPIVMFLCSLCAFLMCVSFAASVFAVDSGLSKAKTESHEYSTLTVQIESLQTDAKRLRRLDRITKAGEIELRITELVKQRSQLGSENMAVKHGDAISIVIAIAIELTGIAMTLIASIGTKQNNNVLEPCSSPVLIENAEQNKIILPGNASVEEQIRNAIITRAIDRPSVKCIQDAGFRLAAGKISAILREYYELGFLKQRGEIGRGYVWA